MTSSTFFSVALIGILGTTASMSLQKPANRPVFLDYGPLPSTIREYWQKCDFVVHGRVSHVSAAEAVSQLGRNAPMLVIHTVTFQIVESLKNDPDRPAGLSIDVRYDGGTAVVNGTEVSTAYGAPLPGVGGEEYVLFLARSRVGRAYYALLNGSAGAFKVDVLQGRATLLPSVAFNMKNEFAGKKDVALTELLETLRKLRDSR
jgi:hypothetical protein